ncbi:50S ribosomal protein L7/L12 [Candidatus Aerophobetes bacterium]|uniref:Large ribosomal subunit protein bL12 n=1 Tax=Aerophobetes bacterium TaxID=2030807 RepID=A0A523Y2Q1_UNCAE|nr:MAG: 50S ribosomal protein L7/L12 [Candidatus Aerophobetes bacterium]
MTTSSEVKKKVKKEDNKKKEVKAGVGKSKKDEIIKAIGQMNVLELSNLVKELREEFGVEALAAPIVAQASGAPEKEEEEKTEFDVILSEMGSKKIQVIKEVRKLTSLGLKEAKDLVEQAPKPIRENVAKEEALKIKETLEAVGAKVEIK